MARITDKDILENQDKDLMLQILTAIKAIRYGYVQITIQDFKVVQIDKTEKLKVRKARDCVCR